MTQPEEHRVSLETARQLRVAGFDVPTRHYFHDARGDGRRFDSLEGELDCDRNRFAHYISRPTAQLAARWLRERHGLHVEPDFLGEKWFYSVWHLASSRAAKVDYSLHASYEEALEAGLGAALRLISGMDKPE